MVVCFNGGLALMALSLWIIKKSCNEWWCVSMGAWP